MSSWHGTHAGAQGGSRFGCPSLSRDVPCCCSSTASAPFPGLGAVSHSLPFPQQLSSATAVLRAILRLLPSLAGMHREHCQTAQPHCSLPGIFQARKPMVLNQIKCCRGLPKPDASLEYPQVAQRHPTSTFSVCIQACKP